MMGEVECVMPGKKSDCFLFLPLLIAFLLTFFIAGCGRATDTSGLVGVWILDSAKSDAIAIPEFITSENRLELRLDPGGSGQISGNNTAGRIRWSYADGKIVVQTGSRILSGSVEGGCVILWTMDEKTQLRFINSMDSHSNEGTTDLSVDAFLGDWYGWWKIEDSVGTMPVSWYDSCATLNWQNDGTVLMTLWDEDGSRTEPLSEISFTPSAEGKLISLNGYFDMAEVHRGEWTLDHPDPALLISEVRHDTEHEDYMATIYLRPWGDHWDGAPEGQRPFYYDDWYLPRLQRHLPMPDEIPWKRLEERREQPSSAQTA